LRSGGPYPLAVFTAPRIDSSLHRLSHYTGTEARHFQNFVIFTNYSFYIDEFCRTAKDYMANGHAHYDAFIEVGNFIATNQRRGGGPAPALAADDQAMARMASIFSMPPSDPASDCHTPRAPPSQAERSSGTTT